MELNSKYGTVKIFTDNIEPEAISQIIEMSNSPIGENAHIRIMPDVHAGKGCTIGTTMKVIDKICPNVVGVDIGCGVSLVKMGINFEDHLKELDSIIHSFIPSGPNIHEKVCTNFDFSRLYCWEFLSKESQEKALRSLGTLGGGNHYIECYSNGYISVHSGSRNIGLQVAKYYQKVAEQSQKKVIDITKIPPRERESYIKKMRAIKCNKELSFLTGQDFYNYLHDIKIIQEFASLNRMEMLSTIAIKMGTYIEHDLDIDSVHNYIDVKNMILRKGAISAQKGELLVIPLNMRDGLLLCRGKGNLDWNYSAPHGAGRLMSRSKAKETISLIEYSKAMNGIYSTCITDSTIDESPFAYKDYQEIMKNIEPTVEILDRLIPIYNFKAT